MTIKLLNMELGHYEEFTLDELFEMINRDRSHEWSEYDETSTIKELTEVIDDLCAPYTTIKNISI